MIELSPVLRFNKIDSKLGNNHSPPNVANFSETTLIIFSTFIGSIWIMIITY